MNSQSIPTYRQLFFAYAKSLAVVLGFGALLWFAVTRTSYSPLAWFGNAETIQNTFNANMDHLYSGVLGIYTGLYALCTVIALLHKHALADSPYMVANHAYRLTIKNLDKGEQKRLMANWKSVHGPIFDGMNRLRLQRGLEINPVRVVRLVMDKSFEVCMLCFGVQFVYSALSVSAANVMVGGWLAIYTFRLIFVAVIGTTFEDDAPLPPLNALPPDASLFVTVPADAS